jgi:hypothetical protein
LVEEGRAKVNLTLRVVGRRTMVIMISKAWSRLPIAPIA